jgi:hypothetical protein
VQDDPELLQRVAAGVIGDAAGCHGDGLVRDDLRLGMPALVAMLIDVTVITRQVAAAADLEHELPEGVMLAGKGLQVPISTN